MASIWLPPSQTRPAFVGFCRICGSEFGSRVYYTQHVAKCAEEWGQELADLHNRERAYNADPDPEWGDYNRALKAAGYNPEVQYNRGRRSGIRRASES